MASMDVFKGSAFSMISLTGAVEKIDYVPNLLGSLGIFEPKPIATRDVAVEEKDGALALIETSPIGAPPKSSTNSKRAMRSLKTTRLAKEFTLYAEEVQGIRAFGSETELQTVQAEYMARMAKLLRDLELTREFHRLGALQGKLLDADGTTVIYDFFDEFGVEEPEAVDFALDSANTRVRKKCKDVKRLMIRAGKGAILPTTQIHALAGDEFYDDLTDHTEVRQTYLNYQAAAELREDNAFESFKYGGIVWHNYRGTDDNSTVAVDPDEAKFFPVGADGVFEEALAPAEFGPFVNTRGRELYAINILDKDREAWTRGEVYSYPLYLCKRPDLLQKAVR